MTLENLGYARLEDFNFGLLPFALKSPSESVVKRNSDNYILPTNDSIRTIYTKTSFGILLLEQRKGDMVFDEPNLDIDGHDAKLVVSKHKGAKWATTVFADYKGDLFRIQANRRLTGPSLDSFLEFCEQIIKE